MDNCVLAAVEIKTKIATAAIQSARAVQIKYGNYFMVECATTAFFEVIPRENRGQLIHQAVVLDVEYVLFVVARNTGLIYQVRPMWVSRSTQCFLSACSKHY